MVFISYLITRLFVHEKTRIIDGDEARHLKTAKTFYRFWNNSFYDYHPPLYSLLSKFAKSGFEISLLSSIGFYFVVIELLKELGLSLFLVPTAMTFLAFNYLLIYYSTRIMRYSLFNLLFSLAFLFLLRGQFALCGIFWGLSALTCSFMGLKFFWIWLLSPNLSSLIIFLNIYFWLWLLPKMICYSNAEYHPSGPEGKLEYVYDWNFLQLISPLYFRFTYAYNGKNWLKKDFKHWHRKIGGIFGLFLDKVPIYNKLFGILTILLGVIIIKGMVSSPLWISVVTIVLLWNSVRYKYNPRNSIMATPLLAYLFAKGIYIPNPFLIAIHIVFLLIFLYYHHYPVWQVIYKRKAIHTSRYLEELPYDGILAEGMIAYPLAHNLNKRVVVMTHSPDRFSTLIETSTTCQKFDLHYAVFSELYKTELHLGYPVIDLIKKCELLNTIKEDNDIYYVYRL